MKVYGLTGGTGSGKSTAAERFAVRGLSVVDADRVGHEVLAPGGAAEDRVRGAFGPGILTCGRIDREKLGALVFGDPKALATLNAAVQPAIMMEILSRCGGLAERGCPAVLIDAALLGDDGLRAPWLDGLVLVLAEVDTRVARLIASLGMAEEQVRQRIDAQTVPESKRGLADWIVENNGSLDTLHAEVDRIAEEMLDASRRS